MTALSEKTRIARKRYACEGCGTPIHPGHQYTDYRGLYDGSVSTARFHVECREAEIKLNRDNDLYDEEWMPLHEHFSDAGEALLEILEQVVADRLRLRVARSARARAHFTQNSVQG